MSRSHCHWLEMHLLTMSRSHCQWLEMHECECLTRGSTLVRPSLVVVSRSRHLTNRHREKRFETPSCFTSDTEDAMFAACSTLRPKGPRPKQCIQKMSLPMSRRELFKLKPVRLESDKLGPYRRSSISTFPKYCWSLSLLLSPFMFPVATLDSGGA
jgi:hypothetical protein